MGNLNNLIQFNENWFNDVEVPEGVDIELLKQNIVLKCGLLTPVYAEPDFFQKILGFWFSSHRWNLERLVKLYTTEYEPLYNYDRYEKMKHEYKDNGDDSDTLQHGHVVTDREQGSEETERKTSAMNSSVYEPDTSETRKPNVTNTETNTGNDVTKKVLKHDGETEDDNHLYGNIGVTTSQQMFESEDNLIRNMNLYDTIVDMLATDLFIGVW